MDLQTRFFMGNDFRGETGQISFFWPPWGACNLFDWLSEYFPSWTALQREAKMRVGRTQSCKRANIPPNMPNSRGPVHIVLRVFRQPSRQRWTALVPKVGNCEVKVRKNSNPRPAIIYGVSGRIMTTLWEIYSDVCRENSTPFFGDEKPTERSECICHQSIKSITEDELLLVLVPHHYGQESRLLFHVLSKLSH